MDGLWAWAQALVLDHWVARASSHFYFLNNVSVRANVLVTNLILSLFSFFWVGFGPLLDKDLGVGRVRDT